MTPGRATLIAAGILLVTLPAPGQQPSKQDRIITAAEAFLGQPYVFGGRDSRCCCRVEGKRGPCPAGIDCQSLIFFAYEKVVNKRWYRFSVMPSENVKRGELGQPGDGLNGVLRADLDRALLNKGDALFFLWEGYNLDADPPLLRKGDRAYGTWHTGLVHGRKDGKVRVIHAKPGDKVLIEPIDNISFDALFAVRLKD